MVDAGQKQMNETLRVGIRLSQGVPLIPVLQYSNTPILHSYSRRITVEIKVLGPGCAKCQQTEKNVKEAVAESGTDAKVEKVTNLLWRSLSTGFFGTPRRCY